MSKKVPYHEMPLDELLKLQADLLDQQQQLQALRAEIAQAIDSARRKARVAELVRRMQSDDPQLLQEIVIEAKSVSSASQALGGE